MGKKDNVMNMTAGNPVSFLIRFAIPLMIGNIFQQLYNLVDSVIVGRLVGSNALAAIGATSSVTFMFFAHFNGIVEVFGRFIVSVAMTKIPSVGLWGIWWSAGIVWLISGFTAWLRYIWYKKKRLHFN